jgi:recombination protein RecA
MDIEEKKRQLNNLLNKMKKLKSNTGMRVGFGEIDPIEFYDTPFPTLNNLTGGGIPKGKFTVIAGPHMTGKTTLMQQWIAHQMNSDPDFVCLWTDAENSLDVDWCKQLGIDADRLIVQKYSDDPEYRNMETILEQGYNLIETGSINVWVIDSIGALIPKSEIDKELVEGKMLDLQRKMGEFFRKASASISINKVACVLVGQVYDVPTTSGVGLQEVRGGNSVKHFAHVRLKARRGRRDLGPGEHELVMPSGEKKKIAKGWAQVLKLDKTKINDKEAQEIILHFIYGRGFDSVAASISAVMATLINRSGAWYTHDCFPEHNTGKRAIHGRDNVVQFLEKNPDILKKLTDQLDDELVVTFQDNESNNQESIKPQ